MNKTKLKAYAPKARKDFIAAVTARANLLGLSDNGGKLEVAVGERKGDIAIIAGREWPVKVYSQREDLIKRMTNEGFNHTVEAVAYTWFNRFAALRYMEIHDYLDHGHRALSNREGGMPEILNHAAELDLPGLNKAKAIELKLAGNKDNDLYKLILVAQCNALSSAMPFLFERIDDETELLLPDNLLLTDSVIAKLVADIPEEDWQEVEIIGWLYQFYISEKKNEVIGKVVKSEDIPAAIQLFTPNWIVQYLVQNSVGRLWLMANPQSNLANEWPYYITPAEQTHEVQAQLDALFQTRVCENGDTLNPESISVLDPACGSGHILVVAYDVLKAIYLERGYQLRAIPRLILEKNLYGLDIDDRAAQMAGFALLMKARADDRRLFTVMDEAGKLQPPKLNVLSLQESKGLSVDELATHLGPFKVQRATITALVETFEHAKTFGSLIQIPYALKTHLAVLSQVLALVKQSGDMYATAAADDLLPLVQQAQVLTMQFDAVVANPPYMGGKGMNTELKEYAKATFPDGKADLFAMFIERGFELCRPSGFNSMVTMQSWMFLSSYQSMREKHLHERTLSCMVHMGNGVMGIAFGTAATVFFGHHLNSYRGDFSQVSSSDLNADEWPEKFVSGDAGGRKIEIDNFSKIPGSPIAYWASDDLLKVFSKYKQIYESSISEGQNITANNEKFLRYFWELSCSKVGIKNKWVFYSKGGSFRKWYGNIDFVVDWSQNARDEYRKNSSARIIPEKLWFREGVTWTLVTSSDRSFRLLPDVATFDKTGSSIFFESKSDLKKTLLFLNSNVCEKLLDIFISTVSLQVDDVRKLPFDPHVSDISELNFDALYLLSKKDWDDFESSWDFAEVEFISKNAKTKYLKLSWDAWAERKGSEIVEVKKLEEENNCHFITAYGLQNELSPSVPESKITMGRPDREKDSQRLISYAIGCMMGRYSLDEPGLIYAHAGNVGFEPSRYATFLADTDGIVPITDKLWFDDEAAKRTREFLLVVWGADTLNENMAWLAESLGSKGNETPEETIRRYLTTSFYKNHLQTYKKRPIYWLFSSGKQGAFQALVYLHRYNEGTLARMRSEYVVPLTGKMLSRIEMLEKDAASVSSPAARTKISKEIEALRKQHIELLTYDEKLRHYADMRIQLDLDDGVKVNYGKFGDLLAEVKAVTGGVDE